MYKRAITKWLKGTLHVSNDITKAYSDFTTETGLQVSRSHFFNVFSNITLVQNIKTGGVYTRSDELIDVLVMRSYFGVNMHNTYAIDEKPIIVNNYKSKSVRTLKKHKGKIASNKVHGFNFLDKLKNVYLICCITCNCVVLYNISESPINTIKFNAFLKRLVSIINVQKGNFLLIDNASFHNVDESIKDLMAEKRIAFTRTPPMGCIFDPIEEFFANFDKILHKKLKNMIEKSEVSLEQKTFIELIHASIFDASKMNLKQIFRRSGLFDQ